MSKEYQEINVSLQNFIKKQHVFFVGTAACEGTVNVSPKGMDTFRVIDPTQIAWLNLTGSGNETAAHILQNPRMTIMFCSFEGKPLILRLYGQAKAIHPRDDNFESLISLFGDTEGARQIFVMDIERVISSCGYSVPILQFQEKREKLSNWAKKKGEKGLTSYWKKNNLKSIDGFDTQIFNTKDSI